MDSSFPQRAYYIPLKITIREMLPLPAFSIHSARSSQLLLSPHNFSQPRSGSHSQKLPFMGYKRPGINLGHLSYSRAPTDLG